ncbi:MAG: response regulator [Proteobacteria bacterium]|nr:response regulator [Pseudomonadota bacterium]MBU1387184.1 response regulator [Pseudomonadota bacterium]MBU1541498.1 response regulator [Pseudomonadota bacterium]MBU2431243.1 response regulator [Pseudomonadota bacterium]MBU2482129.1 response regulator [Pseudomonadota bacterium]
MLLNRYRILVVDDNAINRKLLLQILQDRYDTAFAVNGAQAIEVTHKIKPDLILLDIMMPGMNGYEVCRIIKSDPQIHKIPIIFTTAMNEIEDETLGFDAGCVDYIKKPVSKPIVLARVATHLLLYNQQNECESEVVRRTAMFEESQKSAIYMLGEAGHYNDDDTGCHIWRMGAYAAAVARAAGWAVDRASELELAAAMHDTGKIGIPDSVLKKPGKLNEEEWAVMKSHTTIGYEILSKSDTPFFGMAAKIALNHHEKWDGSGYPNGLKGSQIPEEARIVAICDVFDALTMKRAYKPAWSIKDSFGEIEKTTGSHFDPGLAACFLKIKPEIIEIKKNWEKDAS